MRIGIVEFSGNVAEFKGTRRLGAWTLPAYREIMQAIPGSLWDEKNFCWTYPLSFFSAIALGRVAERSLREAVDPTPEAADWVRHEMAEWDNLRQLATTLHVNQQVPGFFPHQDQTARWLAAPGANGGRLDVGETGSGKTRSSLRAAWACWYMGERGILLVATLKSVKGGWAEEVLNVEEQLPIPSGWHVYLVRGTAAQRRKIIAAAKAKNEETGGVGVVLVMGHEQLRLHSRLSGWGSIALRRCPACGGPKTPVEVDDEDVPEGEEKPKPKVVTAATCEAHDKELQDLPRVAVVFDECHRMMNPEAKLTRAAWAVGDATPRRWGLTGTPGSRSVMENTWALERLAYGVAWPSKSKWISYFAESGWSALGVWFVGGLKQENEPEFRLTHNAIARRVLKAQVLDLPPLLRGGTLERKIEMGKEQQAAYNAMRDQMWVDTVEGRLSAKNTLVQIGRLTGLASGTGLPDPNEPGRMRLIAPSNKADEIVEMVKDGDIEEGTVFQFVSRQLLYLVQAAMVKAKVLERPEDMGIIAGDVSEAARDLAKKRFQNGELPYFAFTVGAGGAGITLTRANTMVAVQRPWSAIQWKQAQDRVYRIGSEMHDKVSIIDLITPGTVEIKQMSRFRENADALEEVVKDKDRLKELLF